MNLFSKFLAYDPSSKRLTMEVGFATPEQLELIEEAIQEGKFFEQSFKKKRKLSKTYKQQCLYYVTISKIVEAEKIRCELTYTHPTKEEIANYDEMMRRDFFPVRKGQDVTGKETFIRVPSIHDLSFDELIDVILRVQDRYSYLGIAWEKPEK